MLRKSMRKFETWNDVHGVHLNRHVSIIQRQADVFQGYIDLVQSYPVNTPEFLDGIMKLHKRVGQLAEEMKEVNDTFVEDCSSFQDVLTTMQEEILASTQR